MIKYTSSWSLIEVCFREGWFLWKRQSHCYKLSFKKDSGKGLNENTAHGCV